MTQTSAASATAAPAAAPTGAPAGPRARTEDVPRLLNRWQVIAVTTCVLFGVLGAGLQLLSWQASGRAADNTEQLVRIQQIQSSLLRADALATNAFLVGGLEATDQRAEYDAALDQVLRQIADAAEAQPADREALAALNTDVTSYATTIAQARDNNRQGFPVGAEYLRGAGAGLRADALPIVAALVAANSDRAENEMSGQHTVLLFLVGVLALAVLWWVNRQLALRFRRRINLGIAGAAVAVAVMALVAVVFSGYRAGANDDLRAGSYQRAVAEASARTAANDAKANESLRLIARGSGQLYEDAWTASAKTVEGHAGRDTLGLWQTYVARHERIVGLDESGDWDQAVVVATTQDEDGSTQALDAFDSASRAVVTQAGQETASSLRSGSVLALLIAFLTLLAGAGAAGAATWGVTQRRKEFA